jgi:hypothetical protein
MLNIEPIKLLSGTHADTGQTGQGCFMNVIAYLNNEAHITDQSTCVCFTIRPIAIWLNDYLHDGERARMLPYIERAMGSATDDRKEWERRAFLAADMAKKCADIAAASAKSAAESAAESAERAKSVAASAAARSAERATLAAASAKSAAESATWGERAAESAARAADAANAEEPRQQIIEACFEYLDAALPQAAEPAPVVVERAREFVLAALSTRHKLEATCL